MPQKILFFSSQVLTFFYWQFSFPLLSQSTSFRIKNQATDIPVPLPSSSINILDKSYPDKQKLLHIVGGRLNQTRLEINDVDHFFSKYISTFL